MGRRSSVGSDLPRIEKRSCSEFDLDVYISPRLGGLCPYVHLPVYRLIAPNPVLSKTPTLK